MIKYRKLLNKDKKYITKLIRQAWFDEEDITDHARNLFSIGYYYMYLRSSDYIEIATNDSDECVGFLFGNSIKPNVFRYLFYSIPFIFTGFRMLFSKDGRKGLQVEFKTFKINRKLKKQVKQKIEGTLELFIVNKEYRKNGIGSSLQSHFIDYLKKLGSKNYSLYTDTFSNYSYYDNNGFKRMAQTEVDFGYPDQCHEDGTLPIYFIYLKEI